MKNNFRELEEIGVLHVYGRSEALTSVRDFIFSVLRVLLSSYNNTILEIEVRY